VQDKAVDLYVMERALRTTHTQDGLIEAVIEGYRGGSKRAPGVLQRLEGVRARGRKRVMVG
jgi:TP53 regulating kinase-like protein